jgi:hypothetical protein
MKDLGPNSPSQPVKQAAQPAQQASSTQQAVSGAFTSLFGFAKNTLNKTLNLG